MSNTTYVVYLDQHGRKRRKTLENYEKSSFSIMRTCCVFRPANGCSARRLLVKISFLMLKQHIFLHACASNCSPFIPQERNFPCHLLVLVWAKQVRYCIMNNWLYGSYTKICLYFDSKDKKMISQFLSGCKKLLLKGQAVSRW